VSRRAEAASPPTKPGKSAKRGLLRRFFSHTIGKIVLALGVLSFSSGLVIFSYFYYKYATLIEQKLAQGPFVNTSKLFGAPQVVSLGDETTPEEIAAGLRRAGYGESRSNRMGWYQIRKGAIEVFPGVESYFQQEAHVVRFQDGEVSQIISLRDNTARTQFWMEPELITNLFDRNREKRRILRFQDIPQLVVNAVLSAEDKRFFLHAGFDPFRILKSAYVDIRTQSHTQGASTLSMQLARSLLLTTERTWRRKAPEILITMHLERKLTKEEIFEHYANQIYLGRVGSFNIHGFGEGAQVFFGKDLRQLTTPEAALLAGVIQSPSRFNPLRYPERARTRRNIILLMMRDNRHITQKEYEDAVNAPLGVSSGSSESEDAPYFVDLVNSQLLAQFRDHDFQANSYRVYTTLDVNLQKAAAEAMRTGLKEVDELLTRRGRTAAKGWPQVQAAMVVLDARTAEVKALIGGRNYGTSQLNRALAKRMPGSAFKPFVYAAALNTGLEGGPKPITPVTTVMDEPTTFWFDDKPYEPNNFKGEFHGLVTLRQALSKSMNIPTVKFAEQIGYDAVVDLARSAGLNMEILATPAVALGAYEVKPIEIAGAYTIFSNRGEFVEPSWIKLIRDQDGKIIHNHKLEPKQVLDPRVAYMMVNLMEEVLRSGTGAGVRGRGFSLPAAGKTGTSHDGWFAGFTSELICVVWVGYDDNRELKLEGSKSALPIWVEFMKEAHRLRPYRRAKPFMAPDGIVTADIDPASGRLASAGCGSPPKTEVFLAGTQPLDYCGGGATQVASFHEPVETDEEPREAARERRVARRPAAVVVAEKPEPREAVKAKPEQRKGILGRILDVFK